MSKESPAPVDALFLERLETLYEKSLADLRAFAQREGCPFEEVSCYLHVIQPFGWERADEIVACLSSSRMV